jgi:hypothetical protein
MRWRRWGTVLPLVFVLVTYADLTAVAKEEARNWLLLRGPGLEGVVRVSGQRSTDLFYGLSGLGRGRDAWFPTSEPDGLGPRYEIRYFIAVEDKPTSVQRLDVYPFAADGVWTFHPSQLGGPYSRRPYASGWWHPSESSFAVLGLLSLTPQGLADSGSEPRPLVLIAAFLLAIGLFALRMSSGDRQS